MLISLGFGEGADPKECAPCGMVVNCVEFFDTFEDTSWFVQRQISHSKGRQYLFSGRATFLRLKPSQLLFSETGTCKGDGLNFEATRKYLYVKESEFQLGVQFSDGSPFYTIRCIELPDLKVEHSCGDDQYAGELRYSPAEIRFRWRVRGPNKDYYSSSLLIPEAMTAGAGSRVENATRNL